MKSGLNIQNNIYYNTYQQPSAVFNYNGMPTPNMANYNTGVQQPYYYPNMGQFNYNLGGYNYVNAGINKPPMLMQTQKSIPAQFINNPQIGQIQGYPINTNVISNNLSPNAFKPQNLQVGKVSPFQQNELNTLNILNKYNVATIQNLMGVNEKFPNPNLGQINIPQMPASAETKISSGLAQISPISPPKEFFNSLKPIGNVAPFNRMKK